MRHKRDDEDLLYLCFMFLAICIAFACMMLITSCASPEVLRERPRITVYTILNKSLVRNQSKTTKIFPLADGFLCVTPDDMRALVEACSDPTVEAK